MYIPKSEFGWNRRTGWLHGDEASYNNAVALMKTVQPGRQRTRPIHPSWETVLQNFDSTNHTRSQGAFCRWADLNRGTFSAMQCKVIEPMIAAYINAWVESWDKPEIDFPICCDLCQKELNTKNELIVSRDMICINSTFQLLEQNLCHECHDLVIHDEFGIPKEFQSEYERLMEKNE